ncbi:InlB B-repeat-containing protein [Anaerovoracaceae bacterium 42-11]
MAEGQDNIKTDGVYVRTITDQEEISISGKEDARENSDQYMVEIYGYIVENGQEPKLFYKSHHNTIDFGSDYDTEATVRDVYTMQVEVINAFSVTFHANGGTWDPDKDENRTVTVRENDSIAMPEAPVRSGYSFKGWSDGKNLYQPGDEMIINEKSAFTAEWTKNYVPPTVNYYTLTIHYTYEDGTQARPDVVETLEEGSSYSVTSPTIDGYTASQNVVSGTLNDNAEFTVTYTENSEIDDPNVPLDPDPGKDDPSIDDPIIDDPDVPLSPGTDLPKDDQNGTQSNKNNTNQPKTGDHAPLMAWTGVLLLSAGLLIPVFARRRKDALK